MLMKSLRQKNKILGSIRVCLDFSFASENESKFAPTKREKQSVAALHEYFRNEVGVNFGHLQRE
jgi:putative IMPACT (imprinted ancient) family translation regulator